jgi:hypothetical protein
MPRRCVQKVTNGGEEKIVLFVCFKNLRTKAKSAGRDRIIYFKLKAP